MFMQLDEILHGYDFEISIERSKKNITINRHEFRCRTHNHAEFYFCNLEDNICNAMGTI